MIKRPEIKAPFLIPNQIKQNKINEVNESATNK